MKVSRGLAVLTALLAAGAAARADAPLRSPWQQYKVQETTAPYACPAVVHLSRDLTTEGFYSDSKSSIIDPEKWKAYAASSGPYKNLGQVIVNAADAWRSTGSHAAAQCVIEHTLAAAEDGVFTGKMSSRQAYYVQGWVIGAIGIAWLKVEDSGLETTERKRVVVPWFQSVVRQTMDFYDTSHAKNNHLYWAGVEAAAIGVACNDRKIFDWAMNAYRVGIAEIQPDGSMPLEMRRGRRALHYHLYALAPLVYLAEFGEVNGLHLFAADNHALARLEHLCISGLHDNSFFTQHSGEQQDLPERVPAAEQISWGVIWQEHFPDPALLQLLQEAPSLSYMYLGGLPPGVHHLAGLSRSQS
ncbi:MAG TPA: alginate lyase family protein [Acidobacteriaceae bacterium]|nr:alginate lyase family protein [Acidobacteriaceae bacterium]